VLDECETVVVGTIFVDDDATSGLNDGSSWVDAFVDLEDALAYSQCSGLVYEIRVAGGTYKPGTDQEDSFHLVNGVELRGGYRGLAGGGDPDERDIDAFESVLSGDIGVIGESGDNCRHVVVCENADATTVIEGFTITEGLASGASGGGMLIMQEGSPTIVQCRFVANGASQGGGIRISHSNAAPTILDCTFSGNRASKGGGLSSSSLTGMTIADCKFSNNSAGNGGGMYIVAGSPTLSNCTFSSNNSGDGGGGMYAEDGSPTLTNCTFSGNFAEVYGGGMLAENASPTLTNCVFSGNSTDLYGGGMYQHDGHTTAVNCTIVGNSAGMWAGGCFNWWETDGVTTCKNCIIWGNTAPDSPQASYSDIDSSCVQGGHPGSGNIDADPLFVDADGPDGIYGTADDDVHLLEGSPCINAGDDEAIPEGVTIDFDGEPRVQQCRVDMGVDETPYFEDCNSNGASDACDISSCDGSAWCSDCNENGIPDECDIASGASTDLNGNGVPDECELFGDCDFDGDVDLDDLEAMLGCLFGPDETPSEGCECGDGDADLDVDLADFALFQQQFTGPLP
jgi:predicted outer membrane repeat protein